MKIAVCIKQVPNTEARLRVSRDGRWVEEEDLPFIINESDEYALEEGLRLAEKTGGEVVVFSLGPERVKEALRKALAVGAARAVHLADPAFAGGDALATGRALAAALEARELRPRAHRLAVGRRGLRRHRLGARRPSRLAPRLAGDGGRARGGERERQGDPRDGERRQRGVRVQLPAVLEIQAGINHPRYASLKGIMAAKKKEIADRDAGRPRARRRAGGGGGVAAGDRLGEPSRSRARGRRCSQGDAKTAAAALVEKLQKEARVL